MSNKPHCGVKATSTLIIGTSYTYQYSWSWRPWRRSCSRASCSSCRSWSRTERRGRHWGRRSYLGCKPVRSIEMETCQCKTFSTKLRKIHFWFAMNCKTCISLWCSSAFRLNPLLQKSPKKSLNRDNLREGNSPIIHICMFPHFKMGGPVCALYQSMILPTKGEMSVTSASAQATAYIAIN